MEIAFLDILLSREESKTAFQGQWKNNKIDFLPFLLSCAEIPFYELPEFQKSYNIITVPVTDGTTMELLEKEALMQDKDRKTESTSDTPKASPLEQFHVAYEKEPLPFPLLVQEQECENIHLDLDNNNTPLVNPETKAEDNTGNSTIRPEKLITSPVIVERTQNSEPRTQNSEFIVQNPEIKNSEIKNQEGKNLEEPLEKETLIEKEVSVPFPLLVQEQECENIHQVDLDNNNTPLVNPETKTEDNTGNSTIRPEKLITSPVIVERTQNSEPRTQNSEPRTQNQESRRQKTEFTILNSENKNTEELLEKEALMQDKDRKTESTSDTPKASPLEQFHVAYEKERKTLMEGDNILSLITRRIEEIISNNFEKAGRTELLIKVEMEEGQPLTMGLKETGQNIFLEIRSGDSTLINFLNTQKEHVAKNLEEKGIYTHIYVEYEDSNQFSRGKRERDEKHRMKESQFRKTQYGEEDVWLSIV